MINRPDSIVTDKYGRKLLEHRKWLFNLKVSDGDT